MKRNQYPFFLMILLLCFLSACSLNNIDELFALPYTSEANQHLQDQIAIEKGEAESISPLRGENTKTIQLVDLDADGTQEVVAFFRDNELDKPLRVVVFKQDEEGVYQLHTSIEGSGTDILSIEYTDVVEDETLELLISFQVSSTMQSLTVYGLHEEKTVELMQSAYTNYLSLDLTQNEKKDIVLFKIDGANPTSNRVELFVGGEGGMQVHSTAPISVGAKAVQQLEQISLPDDVNALIVTYEYEENEQISDLFTMQESGIQNISLNEITRQSDETIRRYAGVNFMDMNDDGVLEIPVTKSLSGDNKTVGAENFWRLNWTQFDAQGTANIVASTYHNISDKWYIELPGRWDEYLRLDRLRNTDVGERGIVFSYWSDEEEDPVPFLVIYRITATPEEAEEIVRDRIVLHQEEDTIYCAEVFDNIRNFGIDEDSLRARFHAM